MAFKSDAARDVRKGLKELKASLGSNPAEQTAYETVRDIVDSLDLKAIKALQRKHAEDIAGSGPNQGPISMHKYIDPVFWLYSKYRVVRRLGLDQAGQKLKILDVGAGACHFARVCRHFGHEVVSIDIDVPLYDDIAATMGEERVIWKVEPQVALPDLGGPFDAVTAIAINFNSISPRVPGKPYWSVEDWAFLLNDLIRHQMTSPARLWFWLNYEYRDGKTVFNPEVLNLFERHGADVDHAAGTIDWTITRPVKVSPRTVAA